jgi:hypothetical protein
MQSFSSCILHLCRNTAGPHILPDPVRQPRFDRILLDISHQRIKILKIIDIPGFIPALPQSPNPIIFSVKIFRIQLIYPLENPAEIIFFSLDKKMVVIWHHAIRRNLKLEFSLQSHDHPEKHEIIALIQENPSFFHPPVDSVVQPGHLQPHSTRHNPSTIHTRRYTLVDSILFGV